MAEKWIQKMHLKKGALTASAKKADETPMQFASEHKHDKGVTGKRARLALVFRGLKKK